LELLLSTLIVFLLFSTPNWWDPPIFFFNLRHLLYSFNSSHLILPLPDSAALPGLGAMSDDDLCRMLAEGDFDGDSALSEMEFCVLVLRLSPELMDGPRR
jgi:hypothetical protein